MTDLNRLRISKTKLYTTLSLDLSVARNKEELVITGNFLKYFNSTNITDSVSIIFNEGVFDTIVFKKGGFVRIPFYRIFISNSAIAGATATIIISEHEEFDCENSIDVNLTGTVTVTGNTTSQLDGSYGGIENPAAFDFINPARTPIEFWYSNIISVAASATAYMSFAPVTSAYNGRYLCIDQIRCSYGLTVESFNPIKFYLGITNNAAFTVPEILVNRNDYTDITVVKANVSTTPNVISAHPLGYINGVNGINHFNINMARLISYINSTNYKGLCVGVENLDTVNLQTTIVHILGKII